MSPILETIETPNGHIMKDGEHKIFFLCKKEADCKDFCNATPCSHTLYLEKAKNGKIIRCLFPHEFEPRFEKLYFNDHDYDWWEKEPGEDLKLYGFDPGSGASYI